MTARRPCQVNNNTVAVYWRYLDNLIKLGLLIKVIQITLSTCFLEQTPDNIGNASVILLYTVKPFYLNYYVTVTG